MNSKNLRPAEIQDFLHARSSRRENRDIVRDLLRGQGVEAMAAAAAKGGVTAALSGFGDGPNHFDSDPSRYADAFSRLLGPEAERASRPNVMLEWQKSELDLLTLPNAG